MVESQISELVNEDITSEDYAMKRMLAGDY